MEQDLEQREKFDHLKRRVRSLLFSYTSACESAKVAAQDDDEHRLFRQMIEEASDQSYSVSRVAFTPIGFFKMKNALRMVERNAREILVLRDVVMDAESLLEETASLEKAFEAQVEHSS
jgi:hypothetical protein